MKVLSNFNNIIMKAIDRLITVLIISLCIMISFQVLNRFILHLPAAWTEEMGRYNFVWVSLFGAVKASKVKLHLSVDALVDGLNDKAKVIVGVLSEITILIFSIILFITGIDYTISSIGVTASFGSFPMTLVYAAIPIAGFILCLISIEELVYKIMHIREVFDN